MDLAYNKQKTTLYMSS